MKKTLLIAAALLAPALANAGWGVSVRSDYVNVMEDKLGVTPGKGASLFIPSYGVLKGTGKVGDADVYAKFDLTAGDITGATNYAPGNFVSWLYMSKAINDSWTLSAGKLDNKLGGYEQDVIENGDDYNASMFNGTIFGNSSGVGATWMGGDHSVAFQAFNGSAAGETSDVKSHALGLSYDGTFGDYGLRIGYYGAQASDGIAATVTNGTLNNWMTVSAKGTWDASSAWFEYLSHAFKVDGSPDAKTTSMIIGFKHAMDGMTPMLKYEMSTFDNSNAAAKVESTGIVAGLEMKPSDDAFRYHVMYTMNSAKVGGGSSNSASMLTAGIKYDADFLK